MIRRAVIAGMLAATSVGVSGQEPARQPDHSTFQSLLLHQCTLEPVSNFAINTKGTGANSGWVSGDSQSATWSRIDLHLTGSLDGGGPTTSARSRSTPRALGRAAVA